ncbi:DNA damage checkpoint protein [Nakaseomyces glabratus]
MDDFSSDDDLLLTLVNDKEIEDANDLLEEDSHTHNETNDSNEELTRALGESSMLRDKLKLLQAQIEQERSKSNYRVNEVKEEFDKEIQKLRQQLQSLEDEKKFLVLESRGINAVNQRIKTSPPEAFSRVSSQHRALNTPDSSHIQEHIPKKRKTEISTQPSIVLNPNRVIKDEISAFFDCLYVHRIVGVELSTIEILNCIKFEHIDEFNYKLLKINKDTSIGSGIVDFLQSCKKNMKLNELVDSVLEHLATLIKAIIINDQELNFSVPFLVALMVQTILFRPSAVSVNSLKDLFIFTCDLIRKFQIVLKKPLHKSPLEVDLGPQIFQYELIDNLILVYSFDLLESTTKVIRIQQLSETLYMEFFDESLMKSLEAVYKLTLTISFKPVINVIYSMVAVFVTITNIMNNDNLSKPFGSSKWWSDLLTRLYQLLGKRILNFHLVTRGEIKGIPNIVLKDDIIDKYESKKEKGVLSDNLELEKWFVYLKDDILSIIENLMGYFKKDSKITNGEILINLTKLISVEQSQFMDHLIDQDTDVFAVRMNLVEHALSIIYRMWKYYEENITQESIKEVESELVMSLWRIIVCKHASKKICKDDLMEHRILINQMENLHLQDTIDLYEDAFEDMPEYIKEELECSINNGTQQKMQVQYDDIYIEMARYILESKLTNFISVENTDSLYLSMGF